MATILIAGFGDVGQRLATVLLNAGHTVVGARRSKPDTHEDCWLAMDLGDPNCYEVLPMCIDVVVYLPTPSQRTESGYRAIYLNALQKLYGFVNSQKKPQPTQWLYVSSTSVYGQHNGEWVDEHSVTEPTRFGGKVLVEAETWLLAQTQHSLVVRSAGIYGPGRERLLGKVKAGQVGRYDYYTNRIHSDDLANLLAFLIQQKLAKKILGRCYVAVDDDPAEEATVFQWLATKFDFDPGQTVTATTNARNKRCSNKRIKSLGFAFKYPSFREGWSARLP